MKTYADLTQLEALVGEQIGTSGWMSIGQARIQQFADATDDHQWIHLDVDRARQGPFGSTIAHGFLTLSLLPRMMFEAYSVANVGTAVNYGLNRVRFPTPVPAGARVRGVFRLLSTEPVTGGSQLTIEATIELEGSSKPACVAESIARLYPSQGNQHG
jgi:acyl dehydratase